MNRTIMDRTRALLQNAGLPNSFWNYGVLTAVYLINRSPTRALVNNQSPIEALTKVKPLYKNLHVFGCICYSKRLNSTKLESKSEKCIFLGYIPNGFRVFNLENQKLQHVRDVVFDDLKLFKDLPDMEKQKVLTVYGKEIPRLSTNRLYFTPPTKTQEPVPPFLPSSHVEAQTHGLAPENETLPEQLENSNVNSATIDSNDYDGQLMPPPPPSLGLRRTHSEHPYTRPENKPIPKSRTPKRVKIDYNIENTSLVQIDDLSKIDELDRMIQSDLLGDPIVNMTAEGQDVPLDYADIKNKPNSAKWYKAVEDELQALRRNKTWKLVDRPPGKNIVGCKFIYKIKRSKTGEVLRYKARLVAQGFSQRFGSDFTETFAPVAKMLSFRIFMALAVRYDMIVEQLDVISAFLQSDLKEQIFMKVPEGIKFSGDKVCLLLYGLKQSPRAWNEKLHT
jgi:hypothetical protein